MIDETIIIHLAIFSPYLLITLWYLLSQSQRDVVLGDVALKVKRYEVQEREIFEEKRAKGKFSMIHDKYKKVFILSCLAAALSLCLPVEEITMLFKVIFTTLYGVLCIINAKLGYGDLGTKIAMPLIGAICFAGLFWMTV